MTRRRGPTMPKRARAPRPVALPRIPNGGTILRAPTEGVASAIAKPTPQVLAELQMHYKRLAMALQPRAHTEFVQVYKAIAHALLFRAQHHGIPASELRQFLRSLIPLYLPNGKSQLGMSDELRQRLETGAGMPQWPTDEERAKINRIVALIYRETDRCPVGMQIRIYWHMLMLNAERLGMTHEAVLLRLEILDRLQREEGPARRLMPSTPPKWLQHMLEKKNDG